MARLVAPEAPVEVPFRLEADLPRHPDGVPHVSIVVLNRNGEALLDQLFRSFHAVNTWTNYRFLIVDHGSTDHSIKVIQRWSATLPIDIVPCARNHTFSYSCNRAAEVVDGDMLFLLNNDIVFDEDVLGRMVAAVQATGGLVGIKLFEDPESVASGRPRRYHHVGIRFRFNGMRRFAAPYNLVPGPADGLIAASCARMPAVTAAAAMCWRRDYLNMGGLDERYVYGYEDVDLGLKFHLTHCKPVFCLNDVRATHGDGLTRRKRTPAATRTNWHLHNIDVLDDRYGYAMRRSMLVSLFRGDGLWMGRRPMAALLMTKGTELEGLAPALERKGWSVREFDARGGDLRGVDVLIGTGGDWPFHRLNRPSPCMLTVRWLCQRVAGTPSRADVCLVTSAELGEDGAAILPAGRAPDGRPPAPGESWDARADQFIALLIERIGGSHRIAIKAEGTVSEELARLVDGLRRSGHSVRIDLPEAWNPGRNLKDDVVLWACAPATLASLSVRPQRGRINILVGATECPAGFDAAVGTLAPDLIGKVVDALHKKRMLGPIDGPLPDRSSLAEIAIQEWDRPNPGDVLLDNA